MDNSDKGVFICAILSAPFILMAIIYLLCLINERTKK